MSVRRLVPALIGVAVLAGLILTALVLPAIKAAPHRLPIGVAAPPAIAGRVTAGLAARSPGGFELHAYADEAALHSAITGRRVYGGLVVDATGRTGSTPTATMEVSSAASPVVAQLLTTMAAGLGENLHTQVAVRDVVALPADDARGAGVGGFALPLLIGAASITVLARRFTRSPALAVVPVVIGTGLIGLAVTTVLTWTGSLPGSYVLSWLVVWGTCAAIALVALGLSALIGTAGIALGVLLNLLIGTPLSGNASAPEMLPHWLAVLGRGFPPGAGGQLLRSVAFFDGARWPGPVITLAGWAVVGLALSVLFGRHHGRHETDTLTSSAPEHTSVPAHAHADPEPHRTLQEV